MLYKLSTCLFKNETHYGELVCEFRFTLCVCVCVRACLRT
jgi:hypothetical protein